MARIETIGDATLYLGDCCEVLPTLPKVDAVVTDPPYPNSEGYFIDSIGIARNILLNQGPNIFLAFWSEIEIPSCCHPIVATHIWHRTNVNGKIYEPIFHWHRDGRKRRSEIRAQPAIFSGAGPGCVEYAGHPTQKPIDLMSWLINKTDSTTILDPFMGSGTTGVAAVKLGRKFIGIEIEPKYFDIACRRIEEATRQPDMFIEKPAAAVQEIIKLE